MRNGICSRCNSAEVYRQAGHPMQTEKVTLKPGLFSNASAPDRYVCTSCGYLEFYILSADNLQTIRDSSEKVTS